MPYSSRDSASERPKPGASSAYGAHARLIEGGSRDVEEGTVPAEAETVPEDERRPVGGARGADAQRRTGDRDDLDLHRAQAAVGPPLGDAPVGASSGGTGAGAGLATGSG